MGFRDWQRRARFAAALERLARGQEVSQVAFELGYETVSGFIDFFKSISGDTPGAHARAGRAGRSVV